MGFLGFGRDRVLFRLPESQADLAVESAELLRQLMSDLSRANELAPRIATLEMKADLLIHEMNNRVDGAFVTPLDKEDLHALANSLDGIIDAIDDTAACVAMIRFQAGRPDTTELAARLVRAVAAVREGVKMVKYTPSREDLLPALKTIRDMESEGKRLFRQGVGSLVDVPNPDVMYVLKWKGVYEWLRAVFDACEHAGNVLESISVKYT